MVCFVIVFYQLCGRRIATSFPNITAAYFAKLDPTKETHVRVLSGSVEAACGLGLADAVVDLVETGTTMRAAGLEEVEVIMTTQTVLIGSKHSKHESVIELFKSRVSGYLTATRFVMVSYNVARAKLPEAFQVSHPNLHRSETKGFLASSGVCCETFHSCLASTLATHVFGCCLLSVLLTWWRCRSPRGSGHQRWRRSKTASGAR
jgi:ATP phosphoribosyltransferase